MITILLFIDSHILVLLTSIPPANTRNLFPALSSQSSIWAFSFPFQVLSRLTSSHTLNNFPSVPFVSSNLRRLGLGLGLGLVHSHISSC